MWTPNDVIILKIRGRDSEKHLELNKLTVENDIIV